MLSLLTQRQVFVATIDQCVIATASLDRDVVRSVFVEPQHQGNGIGGQLMAMIRTVAINNKNRDVTCPILDYRRRFFYFKLGFRKSSR
ncbi:GNAT family N-acetyltransferase [Pseudomonas lini]